MATSGACWYGPSCGSSAAVKATAPCGSSTYRRCPAGISPHKFPPPGNSTRSMHQGAITTPSQSPRQRVNPTLAQFSRELTGPAGSARSRKQRATSSPGSSSCGGMLQRVTAFCMASCACKQSIRQTKFRAPPAAAARRSCGARSSQTADRGPRLADRHPNVCSSNISLHARLSPERPRCKFFTAP